MAYVNIAEWTADQVAEWLRGLDDILLPYNHLFVTKNINGNRLLHLAHDDLLALGISCIGHQEIILQGVELLKNIHYQIHRENVQHIALRLSSKARSIYNELLTCSSNQWSNNDYCGEDGKDSREISGRLEDTSKCIKERVSTGVLSGVADVLFSVKTLVSWLHRPPFHGVDQYDELKSQLLDLSIRLATIAQRDSFAETPVTVIKECCIKLAEEADSLIQNSSDPLILQPASLDVVTLKKRADDSWGLGLFSSYHGVHQISVLRALSPAHTCGKLMGGDQIVQVNYQTVVGWTSQKLAELMQENPAQVILTVKKCPRQVNTITEIYFKPFRLPSKKRTYSPWVNNTDSGQHYNIQSIPNLRFIKSYDGRTIAERSMEVQNAISESPTSADSVDSSRSEVRVDTPGHNGGSLDSENSDLDDDAFISDENATPTMPSMSSRFFQPKPRPHVQRRATIPGATARHNLPFDHLLQEYCHGQLMPISLGESLQQDSFMLRTKGGSEEKSIRPHTCIGTEKKNNKLFNNKTNKHYFDMKFIDDSDCKDTEEETEDENKEERDYNSEETLCQTTPTSPIVLTPIMAPDYRPYTELNEKDTTKSILNKKNDKYSYVNSSVKCDIISNDVLSSNIKTSTPLDTKSTSPVSPSKSFFNEHFDKFSERVDTNNKSTNEHRHKLDKSYSIPTYDLERSDASLNLRERNIHVNGPESTNNGKQNECFNEAVIQAFESSVIEKSDGCDSPITDSSSPNKSVNRSSGTDTTITTSNSSLVFSGMQMVSPVMHSVVAETSLYRGKYKGSRRISCRDLGLGDYNGWLYLRKESKSFLLSYRWEKRWFILKKSYLYGYRDRDALKADSLVYLPGFHVYPASEIKVKRFAFKIYHSSGATFYFACDSAEERSRWMSQMGFSALSTVSSEDRSSSQPQARPSGVGDEEPYYSETDDEFERSPTFPRPSTTTSASKEGVPKESPSKLKVPISGIYVGTSSVTPPSARRTSPLAAVSAMAGGRSGLKFLQSSKSALSQPLPTQNFRSYVRVRDARISPSDGVPTNTVQNESAEVASSEDQITGNNYTKQPTLESPNAKTTERNKEVKRKGSLKEKLKNFPSSLTLERRKNQSLSPPTNTGILPVKANRSHHTQMENTHSNQTTYVSQKIEEKTTLTSKPPVGVRPCPSPSSSDSSTPAEKRRGSVGTGALLSLVHSQHLDSMSSRRGSLDCLVSKGVDLPSLSPSKSSTSSIGSINTHDEYHGLTPENLWINSLRSEQRKSGSGKEAEKLKRAANYQPFQRTKDDTMKLAFELTLSPPTGSIDSIYDSSSTSPHLNSNAKRPRVPPRTKFLSPSERGLSSSNTTPTSISPRSPPNLVLSPPHEDLYSPKSVPKPAMGVPMIGKLKRSTGSLSPREVLPEYPGMEYPPTFEPESYTLNLSQFGAYVSSPETCNYETGRPRFVSTSSSSTLRRNLPSGLSEEVVPTKNSPNSSKSRNDSSGDIGVYINLDSTCKSQAQTSVVGKYKQNVYVIPGIGRTSGGRDCYYGNAPSKPPRVGADHTIEFNPGFHPQRNLNLTDGNHNDNYSLTESNINESVNQAYQESVLNASNEYITMGNPSILPSFSSPPNTTLANINVAIPFTSKIWIQNKDSQ